MADSSIKLAIPLLSPHAFLASFIVNHHRSSCVDFLIDSSVLRIRLMKLRTIRALHPLLQISFCFLLLLLMSNNQTISNQITINQTQSNPTQLNVTLINSKTQPNQNKNESKSKSSNKKRPRTARRVDYALVSEMYLLRDRGTRWGVEEVEGGAWGGSSGAEMAW